MTEVSVNQMTQVAERRASQPTPHRSVSMLSDDTLQTLAESLISGAPPQGLIDDLCEGGLPAMIARSEVERIAAHPFVKAAKRVNNRREKLESLLGIYQALYRQSHPTADIPEVTSIEVEDFYDRYYFRNLPLVIRGYANGWPAKLKWTPQYFAEQFGDVTVEVSVRRNGEPVYGDILEESKTRVLFRDFVAYVLEGKSSDGYLVANNEALRLPELEPLFRDLDCCESLILSGECPKRRGRRMWFGPAGTITPWHHDLSNVLFVQFYGRKQWGLAPSWQLPRMANDFGCFSSSDTIHPSYPRRELSSEAWVHQTVLEPGDALFLPVGWWHRVTSLDVSISATFDKFRVEGFNTKWRGVYWMEA
jgi:hypothetical protein